MDAALLSHGHGLICTDFPVIPSSISLAAILVIMLHTGVSMRLDFTLSGMLACFVRLSC